MSQFDDLVHKGEEAAAAAKEQIQARYDQARTAAADTVAAARDSARKTGERIAPAVARGKRQAAKAQGKFKQLAEEQPLSLVAGAVALGALVGSLLPKRQPPEE